LGTVTDASGGAVQGAEVTLMNEGTNASSTQTSDADGVYKFPPVKIGLYTVTATLQGFQTMTQHKIAVDVGSNVVVNFQLKPGAVSETIEVASTVPVLQTQDSSVGQVMDSKN